MGKYDEFDLDIKQDKNIDIVNPSACTELDLYSCVTVTIEISKAIDCFSKDGQCSGVIRLLPMRFRLSGNSKMLGAK